MYRKNAIRILLVVILLVVGRMVWNVRECINTGGQWNAQKDVCELKLKQK